MLPGSTINVSPLDVTLVDLDGRTSAIDVATFDYWSEPLQSVTVQSGNQAQGGLVFKISADSGPAEIRIRNVGLFSSDVVVDLRRAPDKSPEE